MIEKLLSIFRSSSSVAQKPEATTAVNPDSDSTPPARWLTKDSSSNPFILDGFDCYGFVSSMLSTTTDPAIAESFVSLRSSDGQALRGSLPEEGIEISCALSYEYSREASDGVLFKSAVMEEKWDIYLYDEHVYFCRSWTGKLAVVAEINTAVNSLRISRIWAPRSVDPYLAIQQVDYLIKSHLYKRQAPHPLPSDLQMEPSAVAMYSFSQYGRLCCFGSFESTLGQDMLKKSQPSKLNA